ncbi:hypothetical protein A2Z00_00045 [Candidatus Gottesmanbacteria bacterium RBG_13_45_10]|uniref:Cupin type-2 domain-containing protein n=1 Tax=Candidatus Gottesmanbacteria bacterium RBG_13_45_10 TaxID=1798370 RepID=A0A1F5ZGV9_9BACT|nr:MAG: hypothetical protein A2Z00_00045 [Candidatus Gottesmanbacteria bacterium RBG_13_45_10]
MIKFQNIQEVPASHEDAKDPAVIKRVLIDVKSHLQGAIQMINWAILFPRKAFQAHYHEDMYEIYVIIKGSPVISIDNKKTTLYDGDAVIIEPKEVHEMYNPTDHPIPYIVIGISGGNQGKSVNV